MRANTTVLSTRHSGMWQKPTRGFLANWIGAATAGLAIMLAIPAAAYAKDYCLAFTTEGTATYVARSFTVPAKGKCKPWNGFFNLQDGPLVGTACQSSDGSVLSFTIVSSSPENNNGATFIDSVALSMPSQVGTDVETFVSAAQTSTETFPMSGGPCSGQSVPAAHAPAPHHGPHSLR